MEKITKLKCFCSKVGVSVVAMYFYLTSISVIFVTIILTRLFKSKKKSPSQHRATFEGISPDEFGLVPSQTDKLYESFSPGDTWFFFGFDQENFFQLTLKTKSKGCFFILKLRLFGKSFENCGFLQRDLDGSFR